MELEINQLKVHYQVRGEGRPFLFLHGWGCNTETFESLIQHFEKKFTTYALDFPGFGKSELPPSAWTNDDYVAFTQAFIEKLGIKNPIVLGHSFGGRVAIKLATKMDFRKLMLVGSAGIKPQRSAGYYAKIYTYKAIKGILSLPLLNLFKQQFIDWWVGQAGSADYKKAPAVMRATLSNVVNVDLQKEMPSIKAPTLLLWGAGDTATPVSNAKIMEKLIPNAGLAVLENSGHYVFLDQQASFLIICDKFLEADQ